MDQTNEKAALERACAAVGGQAALARQLEISPQLVHFWLRGRYKRLPGKWVLAVERATKGAVKRHELRPDLYPIEELAA